MISMAKATLGLPGQIIAWFTYLLLLYSLLSAYISGGADILASILRDIHINVSPSTASALFTAVFGMIVYGGIRAVDYINRGLMFGKLGVYLLLLLVITPHVNLSQIQSGTLQSITGSLMLLITSFGFASIVPSLREYFQDDEKMLRKLIYLGSLIPLFCYILWIVVVMGVVSQDGENGLIALMHSSQPTSGLTEALQHSVNNHWISGFFSFFTSICMLTAFLGVSLSLFDFLSDGLKLKRKGHQRWATLALTFLPPLCVVSINPGIYLKALGYGGVCCVVLLLLLPAIMAWRGRQIFASNNNAPIIPGGKLALSSVVLVSVLLLVVTRIS